MKKPHICNFPCDCPNPNDCCHDDSCGSCDQPAVIWFDGLWLCQKHHEYHHACLYRGPHDDDELPDIYVRDAEFGDDGIQYPPSSRHTCDYNLPPDPENCPGCREEDQEARRLQREHEAEGESDDDRTFYVDGKPVPTYGTED